MTTTRKPRTFDFIVLPARGIYARAATAVHASDALNALIEIDGPSKNFDEVLASLGNVLNVDISASPVVSYLQDRAKGKPYTIKFGARALDGGPMALRATGEGERLLRSAGFRVLKQQKYKLIAPDAVDDFGSVAATGAGSRRDFRSELYLESPSRFAGPLGDGVTVGIVDTGIDASHPALTHAVTGGRCFVDGEDHLAWGPSTGALSWHGTHVAGIVAASDAQKRCPDGIAPNAKIRSYRVFGGKNGNHIATIGVINAILAAIDDGCDIINLSLGGRVLREDGVRDAINEAWDSGVICVAAAGNGARRPVDYPAAHPNCVGISALGRASLVPEGTVDATFVAPPRSPIDPDVFLASFSNIGPQIDFAGPGVAIISSLPGNRVGAASGTSMASPCVAAAAAVALSRNNNILMGSRDKDRAAAIFALLVNSAKPFQLGSLDYEGYGIPH